MEWDLSHLSQPPAVHPAAGFDEPGVRPLFYDGLPFRGRATRVFAWLGLPADTSRPVPGMVLVHGGGGTAFAEWVRLWTGRGYAAIAMDLAGHVPRGTYDRWERHAHAGPVGIAHLEDADTPRGPFHDPDGPPADAWAYHAVANVLLANSLLRSLPQVDPDRIGVTGISWGGWVTSTVAGVDPRFACCSPVYGCGFIHESSKWIAAGDLRPDRDATWIRRWEPSNHLGRSAMPIHWINGTNDSYWLNAWARSTRLGRGEQSRSVILRMEHSHGGPGEKPAEVHAFFEHYLRGGPAPAQWLSQSRDGDIATADFAPPADGELARAELLYTVSADQNWSQRLWQSTPATLQAGRAHVPLPAGTTAYVLNAIDHAGRTISADPVLDAAGKAL